MPLELRRLVDFNADRVNFKGFGIGGVATKNAVTSIDYQLTEERLIYGGQAVLENHVFGDSIKFQVVDVDNILGYGAGLVLGEYMTNWHVASDKQMQDAILVEYPTKIIAGLYFRIVYTSLGTVDDVNVKINIYAVKNVT